MTIAQTTVGKTETDLEVNANAALKVALPWLDVTAIQHQLTFSFKLGHKEVEINGTKASSRRGRLDVLIKSGGKRLAILELKKPGQPLDSDDVDQGLSYARVLHPRPPIVIVSNGTETRTYATETGDLLKDGLPNEQAFAALMDAAMANAHAGLQDAIGTLMGPSSDVWMAAIRAATKQTLDELTGDWGDFRMPFTPNFHISRKASAKAMAALRGTRRVIAIEGAPLIGKSHVLRELAIDTSGSDKIAVLLVEASGTAAIGIADEVAQLLSGAVGWRISADEARRWLERLATCDGPQLVIAIDGLGLEHDGIRRELEALSAQSMGPKVKFVVEADTSVVDRLWKGETRRKDTVFARRGERILVDRLDDDEFGQALKVLQGHGVTFMHGADRADEYRQPWLLQSMAAGVVEAPERAKGMTAILPPLLSVDIFRYIRTHFVQDELAEQAATFARAVLDDYDRDDRPHDVILRSMHSFMVRKAAMRDHADTDELAAMVRSGLAGSTLDAANRSVITGRIPELIASELARQIAEQLAKLMEDEEADADANAANWLVATIARLPFGDVIGAQALVDLIAWRNGISVAFLNTLLQRTPKIRPLKPGTRAIVWMPSVGQLNMVTRADGVTVIKKPGWSEGVELPADEAAVTYADLDAWLILSHLASIRIGALAIDEDRIVGVIDPAILALVGTSPILLRRLPEDPERSGYHTHDGPGGAQLACRKDGIIEPVTFSLLRFLEREQDNADEWLQEACDDGSAPLLNRLSQALSILAELNPRASQARWAKAQLDALVNPALREALSPTTD
ncbi:hypothetical protein QE363_002519 [Sphingomonas sp. SORGH_AS870]|uniref:type I restriction enzyme HsdR N-terminal domain-containing protein n=1 Tax=Sphingomonas sp. SORGH_AS_0870 TaxID=3041801 RepID=UPI0028621C24|nr:type I restriction enzyme HsdR N-terminal domain-containing protein [Sphingomonas sp. SORGH_AS_0870]MDR6146726.1 hypothetical protein [Sphingomonas sp. SORGH_AS_0870]